MAHQAGKPQDIPQAIGQLAEKAAFAFDWRTVAARYGFNAVLVLLLLGFIRYDVVKPQQTDNHEYLKSLMRTNEAHAQAARDHSTAMMKLADVQEVQNQRLEKIGESQRQTVTILERVHDAIIRQPSRSN